MSFIHEKRTIFMHSIYNQNVLSGIWYMDHEHIIFIIIIRICLLKMLCSVFVFFVFNYA